MRRSLLLSLAAAIGLSVPALLALIGLGQPVIRILFERGKFDAAAGSLTYSVLIVYALALPAYVATELVTRGLIALLDTRTPLLTNTLQLIGRSLIMAMFVSTMGVVAIPAAFAITASAETIALAIVLLLKLRQRIRANPVAPGL